MPNDYPHKTWSRAKRLEMVASSKKEDEDIVCSIWQHIEVHKRTAQD